MFQIHYFDIELFETALKHFNQKNEQRMIIRHFRLSVNHFFPEKTFSVFYCPGTEESKLPENKTCLAGHILFPPFSRVDRLYCIYYAVTVFF